MNSQNPLLYRASQLLGFLLGARIFVLLFFTFALYVSTFFLFSREESLRNFVFDFKVHGIIFCSVLSIAAGGIINQFYDLEKDRIQKPFRTRLQSFLKQKYYLYSYVLLNVVSLGTAWVLSPRIFLFFLVYQFFIWFYSHRVSKLLFLNNLIFVSLSLYPFFGMLVYYRHFSWRLFLMAAFLFLVLLTADVIKDILTLRADKIFGYQTVPAVFGVRPAAAVVAVLLALSAAVSCAVAVQIPHTNLLKIYYTLSAFFLILMLYPVLFFSFKKMAWLMNLLRVWIFFGVLMMFLNGIFEKF